jgi:hypothetical protein
MIFDHNIPILILTALDLERSQLQMIGHKIELDLPHPNSIKNDLILILEGDIEKDRGLNELSILEMCHIEIEIDGIFSERVDAYG